MTEDPARTAGARTIQTYARRYTLTAYGLRETSNAGDVTCPICLEQTSATPWVETHCGHLMHRTCALKWLKRKRSCPCCRAPIVDRRIARADADLERCQTDLSMDVDLLIGLDDDCLRVACAARKRTPLIWADFSHTANRTLRRAYALFRSSPKSLVAFALLQRVQAIDELRSAMRQYDSTPFKPFGRNLPHEWKTVIRLLKLSSNHVLRGPCMNEAILNLEPAHNTRNHELIMRRAHALQTLFERRKVLKNDIHMRKSLLERIVTRNLIVREDGNDRPPDGLGDVVERVMSIQTLERMMRNSPALMIEGIQIEAPPLPALSAAEL